MNHRKDAKDSMYMNHRKDAKDSMYVNHRKDMKNTCPKRWGGCSCDGIYEYAGKWFCACACGAKPCCDPGVSSCIPRSGRQQLHSTQWASAVTTDVVWGNLNTV